MCEELAEAATQAGTADHKLTARRAAEVHKRAKRLKSYLSLPEPKEEVKGKGAEGDLDRNAPSAEGLASLVSGLRAKVRSFVSNPYPQNPGTLDAVQATVAHRDLQSVIELSADVRKAAKALSKVSD